MLKTDFENKLNVIFKSIRTGFLCILIIFLLMGNVIGVTGATWQSKVDKWVMNEASITEKTEAEFLVYLDCLLYTSPSPRDRS